MQTSGIDNLIKELRHLSQGNLSFAVVLDLGYDVLKVMPDSRKVSALLGPDTTSEATPANEVKQYFLNYAPLSIEFFQAKAVYEWQTCLDKLFGTLLDAHFQESRYFRELRKQSATIDFSSPVAFKDQVIERLKRDFEFWPYKKRIKLIKEVLGETELEEHFDNVPLVL